IPGVPGVGPKTAAPLLQHFGNIDALFDDIEAVAEVKVRGAGKLGAKLEAHKDDVLLSRRLATIITDVDLDFGPDDLTRGEPDEKRLREIYERFELRTLLRQLSEPPPPPPTVEEIESDYSTITTVAELDALVAQQESAKMFAIRALTTRDGYMDAEIVGLAIATAPGQSAYIPFTHDYDDAPEQLQRDAVLDRLKPLLADTSRTGISHDGKLHAHVLGNYSIDTAALQFDSMLEAYVLNSTATRHDIESLATRYLERKTIRYEEVAGKGAKQMAFGDIELDQAAAYAAEQADITLQLHRKLWPRLRSMPALGKLYTEIEQPLIGVLRKVEENGVLIDTDMLDALSAEFGERMAAIEATAYDKAGVEFNLESPKQLREVLFDKVGLPVLRRTRTKQPSTAEDVLSELAAEHELPQLILDHRSLSKLRSTYTEKLGKQVNATTGRVHTTYHQAVAATGRLSSSDPNLQNIPIRNEEGRRIRQAFIAADGHVLLAADYSQIELRIMAHLSDDAGLLDAFVHDRDIHRATAAEVFGLALDEVTVDQRRAAKAINFGLIYGMSAFGLARQLNIQRRDAQTYVDLYFERYPGVREYMDRTRKRAREQGYIETVFGRRLYLDDIASRNAPRRQYAERSAINAPMQGTAADIIKLAMIRLQGWLDKHPDHGRLIMQVHDELVLEVPRDKLDEVTSQVTTIMAGAAELKVPLKVDAGTGPNWDEAH
ncbi:MAG: DNA polymerase I, partial [Gammaproteobacteria bacterium]|nr:DNA polymerase I [Gammaproteobacteria bacterium]